MSERRSKRARIEDLARDNPSRPKKVVGYIRVSTPGQEREGYSLEFQREKLHLLTEGFGRTLSPSDILVDVRSGADWEREWFLQLREAVASGEVDHLVLYDDSRLSRDPLAVVGFIRDCKKHGVTVHFADGSRAETFMDEFVRFAKGFVGMEELLNTRKRTMDGKRMAATKGKMPNGTGAGLYGYLVDPATGVRVIYELEAAVVRQAYQWRLAGASYSDIARWLNELGIKAKKGGKWSHGTVRTMLRNEAYTGEHWWGANRYEQARDPHGGPKRIVSVRPEEEWVRMTGYTPMIIEPQLFWPVQQVALRKPRRGKEWDYFLTEFFYCGQCGSNVCGDTFRAGQQKRAYTYWYYRCEGAL